MIYNCVFGSMASRLFHSKTFFTLTGFVIILCLWLAAILFQNTQISPITSDNHRGFHLTADRCRAFLIANSRERMQTIPNCAVLVYESSNRSHSLVNGVACASCNRDLFKRYYSTSSNFLSDGFWNVETAEAKPQHISFQPSICKFSTAHLDSAYIRNCLGKRNITKIISMGDSNGKRTLIGLKSVLLAGINNCKRIREERSAKGKMWPHLHYYLWNRMYNRTTDVATVRRQCNTCRSVLLSCSYDVADSSVLSRTLILEHPSYERHFQRPNAYHSNHR